MNWHTSNQSTTHKKIFGKPINEDNIIFREIINNYEEHINHKWFPKTKIKLDNGPPLKRYTKR